MNRIFSLTYTDNKSGGPFAVSIDHKSSLEKNFFYVKLFSHNKFSLFKLILNKKRFKKFLNKFDCIHLHILFSFRGMFFLKIAEQLAIPTVLSLHGNLNQWSMKRNFFRKLLFLKFFNNIIHSVSLIHFLNNIEKEEASKFIDIKKIPYSVNQNCLDVSNFDIKTNNNVIFRILFFGRIDEKKNFLILPEIAYIFKKNNINNIKFMIVGPGTKDNINKLKNKIKKLELDAFFEIRESINSINQKKALFRETDIFILPSKDEADSIAIKEALASGKPVVISKECKILPDDKNQEFIKIIDNQNVNSYYNELLNFYKNRKKLKNLSYQIHLYSEKNFSINLLAKWLPKIYKNSINHTHTLKN